MTSVPHPQDAATREIKFEHSLSLPGLLNRLGCSLLVSTYQAGKLAVVGARGDKLSLQFHNFERAMGVAIGADRIAVGARSQIWFLHGAPQLAPRIEPPGTHDACFLTRRAHFTGEIQCHELAWAGRELWVVNTLFSCLCTLHDDFTFVPRWRPPFVSALAAEDRCHLNGLGLRDGRPRYVTCLAETDTQCGWRPNKATTGCVLDLSDNCVIARGFAMPHSPRFHEGRLWLLDSGAGRLVSIDPASGQVNTVAAELPGYGRGLALCGRLAFIGLSRIRETSTFGGIPIAERRETLKCGVAVIDIQTGQRLALLEFKTGVEEIFDVQLAPGMRQPALSGPFATLDGGKTIWMVPEKTEARVLSDRQRPPGG